jgi:hypothetical protein
MSFQLYSLVRYPHKSELARFLGIQKCFPGLEADSFSSIGAVYEKEVQIVYCRKTEDDWFLEDSDR